MASTHKRCMTSFKSTLDLVPALLAAAAAPAALLCLPLAAFAAFESVEEELRCELDDLSVAPSCALLSEEEDTEGRV